MPTLMVATAEDRRRAFAAAFSGDTAAFRAWYDDAVVRVYGYLFGRCGGDIELAEELTQQTFLQAVRRWQQFDGRSDDITWLCTIARHRLVDHHRDVERQRRRHLRLLVREVEVIPASHERGVGDRDAILEALRRLPAIDRTALVLRYVDDLSVKDVAALLGRTVDAADALIRRAKDRFRAVYVESDDG